MKSLKILILTLVMASFASSFLYAINSQPIYPSVYSYEGVLRKVDDGGKISTVMSTIYAIKDNKGFDVHIYGGGVSEVFDLFIGREITVVGEYFELEGKKLLKVKDINGAYIEDIKKSLNSLKSVLEIGYPDNYVFRYKNVEINSKGQITNCTLEIFELERGMTRFLETHEITDINYDEKGNVTSVKNTIVKNTRYIRTLEGLAQKYLANKLGISEKLVKPLKTVDMTQQGLKGKADVKVLLLHVKGLGEVYLKAEPEFNKTTWQFEELKSEDPLVGATKAKLLILELNKTVEGNPSYILTDENLIFNGAKPLKTVRYDGKNYYKILFTHEKDVYEAIYAYDCDASSWACEELSRMHSEIDTLGNTEEITTVYNFEDSSWKIETVQSTYIIPAIESRSGVDYTASLTDDQKIGLAKLQATHNLIIKEKKKGILIVEMIQENGRKKRVTKIKTRKNNWGGKLISKIERYFKKQNRRKRKRIGGDLEQLIRNAITPNNVTPPQEVKTGLTNYTFTGEMAGNIPHPYSEK